MENRLNLSKDVVRSAIYELIKVKGELDSYAMPENEQLNFHDSWNSWYRKFLIRVRRAGGFLEEYIVNGVVHPGITSYHENIIDNLLLATVSSSMYTGLNLLHLTGRSALLELRKVATDIPMPVAMKIIDKIVNNPFDGSTSLDEHIEMKMDLIEDLKFLATDMDAIYTLLMLYSFRQPKLYTYLMCFPIKLTPHDLTMNLKNICQAIDIPIKTPDSKPLRFNKSLTPSASKKKSTCYRCGNVGHTFRQCESTIVLDSWRNKNRSKKKLPVLGEVTSMGIKYICSS